MKHCTPLFQNAKGTVWQDDRGRGFWLEWLGDAHFLRFPQFQELLRQAQLIDLESMVMDASAQGDFTIFSPGNTERLFVLTLCEAWMLKELLEGAQVMLDLHRIVQDRLYTFACV